MEGDTGNPRVWLNGDVFVADVGAGEPTDVTDDLPALGFAALGLLSEDGLTEKQANDVADRRAWGGVIYRTTRTNHKRTFTVACLEDTALVFDLVNPGSTSVAAGGIVTRTVKTPTPNPKAFVFKAVDGEFTSLVYIPTGEVTEVAEIPRNQNDPTMFALTITVYPSADGELYTELTDNPAAFDGS